MDPPRFSYHPQAVFEWALDEERLDDPAARRFLGPVAATATTTTATVHAIHEGQSSIYNTISTHTSPPYPSPLSASQLQPASSMTNFAIPDSCDVRAKSEYQDYSYPSTSSTNNASTLAPPPPSVVNYSQMSHPGPTTTASTGSHLPHPTSMPTPYYDPSSPSSYIHMDYSQRRQYLPSSRSTAQQPGPIRPRLWRVRSRPYQDPNAAATGATASNGGSSAGSASSPSSEMQLTSTPEERRKALREQFEAQIKLLPIAPPPPTSHPVEDVVSSPGTPLVQPSYLQQQPPQQQQQQQQPPPAPQVDQQYAQTSLATPQSAGPSTHHSHHHHQYTHQTTHPHHLSVINPPLAYHHHHPHAHHHQPQPPSQTQTHYHTDTKEDITNADADPKPFSIDARSSNSSPAVPVASAAIENQYTTVFIHSNLPRRSANGGTGVTSGAAGAAGSGSSVDDGAEDYAEFTNFFPLQTEEHRQLRIAMRDIMVADWKQRNELEPTSRDILQFSNKIIGDDGLVKYTCLLYHNGEPCAKSWVRAERMLAHLRGAIDLRPFACEGDGDVCNCGLRFFAEDTLQQHRKNTRTIGCEYCGAAVTPRNIKRHLRHNCAKAPSRGQ